MLSDNRLFLILGFTSSFQIIGLEEGLKDPQDKVRLDRMCILLYSLKCERLGTYLEMNGNADLVTGFVKELSKNRIFNEDLEWFRHELVKKCETVTPLCNLSI